MFQCPGVSSKGVVATHCHLSSRAGGWPLPAQRKYTLRGVGGRRTRGAPYKNLSPFYRIAGFGLLTPHCISIYDISNSLQRCDMAKVKEVDPQKITFLDEGEEVLYTATNNVGWIAEASTQYGIDFIPGWFGVVYDQFMTNSLAHSPIPK